jgi:hypothetical protein
MKKKIINGIMLAAMFVVGTTSFVSCKDNIDDEAAGIRVDISSLDGRVGKLETTVAGHTDSITNLRRDLTALTKRVRQNEIDIDSLEIYYARLAQRVSDLEKWADNLIVDVIVQGTVDPVLGSADGFVIDQKTLCGFVGKNGTGITEFPEIGGDSDLFGVGLTADEVPTEYLEFNPDNKYLNDTVKLGSVYLTLNPIGADATKVNFALLNTVGEATGAEFGTPVPNTTVLTKSFLNRYQKISDYVSHNNFPVVWEIPVKMATTGEDFDENLFDYLNFGGEGAKYGKWNLQNLAASFKDVWKTLTAADGGNTPRYEKGAAALSKLNKIFDAIKEGIDLKYKDLNKYGVFTTTETGVKYFSEANIISVAMEPISYKTAKLFDEAGVHWDLTDLKAAVKRAIGRIQEKFPKANINNIQFVRAGGQLYIYIDTDSPEAGIAGQHYEIPVATALGTPGSSITEEQLARYSELFTEALGKYRYLTGSDASEANPIAENLVNKVENYLNLMTGELIDVYYNGHVAMTTVEPILVTEATGDNGVTGPVILKDDSYGLPNKCEAGPCLFALTSLLKDYIVPVYKKYIGVVQDGKLIDGDYEIADGDQQVFALTIPEGESTIVIQTLDYAGNTITKRFLIKAE